MEKFLRSPFIMMLIVIIVGIVFIGVSEDWPIITYYIPFFGIMVFYYALLLYHNHRNPERKIKIFTIVPYELREDDEGLQYITFRAMRKVYIFYYFAIPIGILLTAILQNIVPYFSIGLLVLFSVLQYFIYWLEIRKALKEED